MGREDGGEKSKAALLVKQMPRVRHHSLDARGRRPGLPLSVLTTRPGEVQSRDQGPQGSALVRLTRYRSGALFLTTGPLAALYSPLRQSFLPSFGFSDLGRSSGIVPP